ncbi:Gastrula zinc finger protein XlCGF26.1 [Eumeta japonica]|uniref:Gastrula zinc finger protein XlCGF26.1 n=1 Tax=Eumeta variegata TaxID=151549 RepID=A0A4C1TIV9_EUMVA|nr:Gastrula zinc finger protein XlCGF26.1 [Eumeta japonica]
MENLLCMACLCVGRSLRDVTDENMKRYYLNTLSEIPLCDTKGVSPVVCWECDVLLKKTLSFREQIKDCYRILQTYNNENLCEYLLSDASRPPRLKVHNLKTIDITPAVEIEVYLKNNTEGSQKKQPDKALELSPKREVQMQHLYIKEEGYDCSWTDSTTRGVKEETRNCDSDCPYQSDDTGDLLDIENEIKTLVGDLKKKKKIRTRKDNKERKVKRLVKKIENERKDVSKIKNKGKTTDQKIITIELSYEEMLEERRQAAKREYYTSAELKCENCLLGFNLQKSYLDHMASKHSPELGEYSCPICKTVIASIESFTAHYKRHLRRYECGACGKRSTDRKALTQHYAVAHADGERKQYTCTLCGKISHSIDAHRYHRGTHRARVACTDCDKTFSHRAGLMNHRLAVHKLNNVFPCSACEKVFRWKTSLKKHLEKHDDKGKSADSLPFCTPCGVSFSSVSTYQRHLKNSLKHVTVNELKFICADCNRKFANKTKLRDHIEEKHLHKTYQCYICHKPSKNRVCLDQHIRNVHRGRPNNKICHHCGKGFPTKVQLESHIRSHTGERPFICEYCPTTFSQQSNLYKHNRQVHMNIKAKRYPMCRKRKEPAAPEPVERPPAVEVPPQRPVVLLHVRGFDMT